MRSGLPPISAAVSVDVATIESPVGPLTIAARDRRVCAVFFGADRRPVERWLERRFGAVEWRHAGDPGGAAAALQAYFDGELRAVDAIDVDTGGTPFQQSVWSALRTIGPGTTVSYGALARSIGWPDAARAVGAANGANPIAVVIPCHRVIGTAGTLVGYGGGLERKQWLLAHEGAISPLLGRNG
jgi:methylated-DNA-[protein]-cysteine S-methyltransferase